MTIRYTRLLSANLCLEKKNKDDFLFMLFQVRVVILADHPLEDIFVQDQGDHGHDESHILMDDLGLKRVRAQTC